MRFLLALLCWVALPAAALEAIRVSPSVYYIRGESGVPSPANRGHTSNAGFVVTREGVVVFDALGTPVLGREFIAAIRKAWIAAIDRIVKFNPKVLIGGHGDASRAAAADLRFTRDYLVYLREKMGVAAAALDDFDAAYAKTEWSRFSHLPAFDVTNRRNAFNTFIRMQGGEK